MFALRRKTLKTASNGETVSEHDLFEDVPANMNLKAVRVLRTNACNQEHEYLMEDGSVQTLPLNRVMWKKETT